MKYYRTWMESNAGVLQNKTLKEICLPATHDSGTCALTNTMSPDPKPWLAKVLNIASAIAQEIDSIPGIGKFIPDPATWVVNSMIPSIRGTSTCTTRTIAEQLDDGIRCFDLRVFYNDADETFYTYHGLIGTDMQRVLADIREFLKTTAGEIVYVTFGHYLDFHGKTRPEIFTTFNDLVENELEEYAYLRDGTEEHYTNNPFDQTYASIIGQGGVNKSRAILVNAWDTEDESFWPKSFSPPNNPLITKKNPTGNPVLAGRYTETSNRADMLSDQHSQLKSANGRPFALYLTLTMSDAESISIVISSLYSAIAKLAVSLFIVAPGVAVTIAPELLIIAATLATYHWALPWTTLQQLSQVVNRDLYPILLGFQPIPLTGANALSFIYTDYYEQTDVVDMAIYYSGCKPATGPRMNQVFGVTNARNSNLEVFGVGADSCLYHTFYGGGWNQWQKNFQGAPADSAFVFAATNAHNHNLEVFLADVNGVLWHTYYDGQWYKFAPNFQGAQFVTVDLFAISNGRNKNLEVFAIDNKSNLWHCYYDGSAWSSWASGFNREKFESRPSRASSVFAANNPYSGNLEVFLIADDHTLWHCYFDGGWQPWSLFNRAAFSVYHVFAATNNLSLMVFAIDVDGVIWSCACQNGTWGQWDRLNDGEFKARQVFAATNPANQNLDVFAVADDHVLYYCYYDGDSRQPWTARFNQNTPPLNSVFAMPNLHNSQLELCGIGPDDVLSYCYYSADSWQPWAT